MHELSLCSVIPRARHGQILQILQAVCTHTPQVLRERIIILYPKSVATGDQAVKDPLNIQVGGSQEIADAAKRRAMERRRQKDSALSWIAHLVEKIEGDAALTNYIEWEGRRDNSEDSNTDSDAVLQPHWSFTRYESPDPAIKNVAARAYEEVQLQSDDDLPAYISSRDYVPINAFFKTGHRFTWGNVNILLTRPEMPFQHSKETSASLTSLTTTSASVLEQLRPFDPSDAFLLETKVLLTDGNKPDLLDRGTKELMRFKDLMKGCVDLRPPDRGALNNRAT